MFSRLQLSILLSLTLVLVSCANQPNVSRDSLFSANTGSTVNTFRGKIYFGEDIQFTQLVIAPDAMPFLAYEPIVLSANQNGTVAIRTDSSAATHGRSSVQSAFTPDLLNFGERLPDFPQCPQTVQTVSTRQGLLSSLR